MTCARGLTVRDRYQDRVPRPRPLISKPRPRRLPIRPRCLTVSRDRLVTETSIPRPHPCH